MVLLLVTRQDLLNLVEAQPAVVRDEDIAS